MTPLQVVDAIFENPTSLEHVAPLCSDDFVYVSLNFDDPLLKQVMPWAGTTSGAQALVQTFTDTARYWRQDVFEQTDRFESEDGAAIFGTFTFTSRRLGKTVTSPFSILARCRDGKCRHWRFMEDTFATVNALRDGGVWIVQGDPEGLPIRL